MVRRFSRILPVLVLCLHQLAYADAAEKHAPPMEQENYYELYKLVVDTVDQVERNYVTEVDRRELIEAAVRGVLARLDPYSTYIGPKEIERFRAAIESEFAGIGIQIALDEGDLKILSPIHGTPAYKAGLLAGDRILEIDGKSTDDFTIDDAVERLKGKEGTAVVLTILHPHKDDKVTVSVKRERIHVETVLGDRRGDDGRWDFFLDRAEGIGYLRVTAFSRDTAAEMKSALEKLRAGNVRGLVLDLRFNPGGLLTAAVEASNLFIAEGRIVSTKGRNSPERIWNAKKTAKFADVPLVVLVNRFSASASEIVAACLQDHHRAGVVGERTWGKGSVQNVIEMEEGRSALKLTTAAYLRPSGKNIHRFPDAKETDEWGVTPDEGYLLKLDEDELYKLLAYRRDRDILRTPGAAEPKNGNGAKPFVDRQLELAVKKLKEEIKGPGARDQGLGESVLYLKSLVPSP
ncbi:MAG: S41 family peptidase [Pirellulales bacterium]|nr:S41 family peptidase [Pirellulales bacterium]